MNELAFEFGSFTEFGENGYYALGTQYSVIFDAYTSLSDLAKSCGISEESNNPFSAIKTIPDLEVHFLNHDMTFSYRLLKFSSTAKLCAKEGINWPKICPFIEQHPIYHPATLREGLLWLRDLGRDVRLNCDLVLPGSSIKHSRAVTRIPYIYYQHHPEYGLQPGVLGVTDGTGGRFSPTHDMFLFRLSE